MCYNLSQTTRNHLFAIQHGAGDECFFYGARGRHQRRSTTNRTDRTLRYERGNFFVCNQNQKHPFSRSLIEGWSDASDESSNGKCEKFFTICPRSDTNQIEIDSRVKFGVFYR